LGHSLEFRNLRILFTKDGDTYSAGELYYQLLVNDQIISANAECIIVPDGTRRYLSLAKAHVPERKFKVDLRIDELDCTKDDCARCTETIDLDAAGYSSEHSLRARGAQGRLDCTISFTIHAAGNVAGESAARLQAAV
jgi:hypothetical protein